MAIQKEIMKRITTKTRTTKKPVKKLASLSQSNLPILSNYRIFEIKYLGATNTSGTRVKIIDHRFQENKTIPYNYSFNNTAEVAHEYFRSIGIKIEGKGEGKDSYIMFTKNFDIDIKQRK